MPFLEFYIMNFRHHWASDMDTMRAYRGVKGSKLYSIIMTEIKK